MRDAVATVVVAGRRTRLLDAGVGDPVVLLHGWGGRLESMAPIAECLRRRARVLAPDLIGFGEADAPEGAWGTPDHAEFVADLLAGAGVGRAHFVGHSFGAKTSLYLAATHPALVDKLVVVGSPGLRMPPSARARARRAMGRGARVIGRLGPPGRRVRDAVYARVASEDYRAAGSLRPMLVRVVNEDFRHLLPAIKSPTLLVWGTEDDAVPLAHAREMERLIPDAGLVVFEGAGHFSYLDDPGRFCRVLSHFLYGG
jgi:pimeloyl-ACP methyl ester carboxylesterase